MPVSFRKGPVHLTALAMALCFFMARPVAADEDPLSPEQAFRFSARVVEPGQVEVRYRIADGYYLYRDKLRFSAQPETVALGEPDLPSGKIKQDEFFGKVETYRGDVAIRVPFTAPAGTGDFTLKAQSQGCADAGLCYTPQQQTARLQLAALSEQSASPKTGVLSKLRQMARAEEAEPDFLPPDQAFKVTLAAREGNTVVARFAPAEGYYLYRDKISFSVPKDAGISITKVELPPGEKKSDPNFGETVVFHAPFEAVVTLDRKPGGEERIAVDAKYQGCSEKGLCYPPAKKRFDLVLAAWQPGGTRMDAVAREPAPKTAEPVAVQRVADSTDGVVDTGDENSRVAQIFKSGHFWPIVASFFGFGLLLALTPCVFPMIPILSGIIVGQGKQITKGHAFALSLIYVIGMAVTYALAGVAAGLSGTLLSNALQNPWVLGAFAALFVLLSLSMFGFYELQLPASLQSKLSDASNRMKGGTFWGVFAMGVLSALIVGPCVAAPLAGALLYINKSRDALLGGSALFSMALGMGVPLLAVGLSAGTLMPRAGAWMQTVKNFFGVVLLGMAVWIISPVIPQVAHMLLWAGLLIVSAIYLHALDPLPQNASGFRKLWKGVGVISLLVGVALLLGALAGGRDVLQPLSGLRLASGAAGGNSVSAAPVFQTVRSVAELEQKVAQATGKPVLLDFYADWCVSCKEMERFTFTDPAVRSRMDRMLLLKADVTANTADDAALLKRYDLFGPPGTIFFDRAGKELPKRVIGFQPAEQFSATLDAALGGS